MICPYIEVTRQNMIRVQCWIKVGAIDAAVLGPFKK